MLTLPNLDRAPLRVPDTLANGLICPATAH